MANNGPVYLFIESGLTIKDYILVLPFFRCYTMCSASFYNRKLILIYTFSLSQIVALIAISWKVVYLYMTLHVLYLFPTWHFICCTSSIDDISCIVPVQNMTIHVLYQFPTWHFMCCTSSIDDISCVVTVQYTTLHGLLMHSRQADLYAVVLSKQRLCCGHPWLQYSSPAHST